MFAVPEGYELHDDKSRVGLDDVWEYLSTEAYWGRWRTREQIEHQFQSAWRISAVRHTATGRTVGYARAVSDGVSDAYLADVYVHADHRGRGLGIALVALLVTHGPGANLRWMLHTADAHDLYRKFGFAAPEGDVMERRSPRTDLQQACNPALQAEAGFS